MTTRYYANNLTLNTFPWIYVDEAENKVFVLAFHKMVDEVEQIIWDNYNEGANSFIHADDDVARTLDIDNIKDNIIVRNINIIEDAIPYTGAQIGAARANALFLFTQATVYAHNSSASALPSGKKGLQFWEIQASEHGSLSVPHTYIFDKQNPPVHATEGFVAATIVNLVVGLDNSGLANTLLIAESNPTHGYYCNQPLTYTANINATIIDYLPKITMAAEASNTVLSNSPFKRKRIDLSIDYTSAQTEIQLDVTAGGISQKEIGANSTANVFVSGLCVANTETVRLYAGWANYKHVANLAFTVLNEFEFTQYSVVTFNTAGNFTWTVPFIFDSIKMRAWGGGGGGASAITHGNPGGNSIFNGTVFANGGGGGIKGEDGIDLTGAPGTPGGASGGDINIAGGIGGSHYGLPGLGSNAGASFNGVGGDGGAAGFAEKVYSNVALTPGSNVSLTVGAKGTGAGSNGYTGAITIEIIRAV